MKIHVRCSLTEGGRSFAFPVIELEHCTKEVLILINHLNNLVICVWIISKPAGGSDDQCVNYHYHSDIKTIQTLDLFCTSTVSTMNMLIQALPLHWKLPALSITPPLLHLVMFSQKYFVKRKEFIAQKNTKINTLIYTHVADLRCSRWNMSPWDSGMRQERAT